MSQDFQFQWPSTFYSHHLITQGYTNEGQWLGAGIGTGGNSQYLGYTLFYPAGSTRIFASRVNPDNDYLFKDTVQAVIDPSKMSESGTALNFFRYKTSFAFGADTAYSLNPRYALSGGFVYNPILNPVYEYKTHWSSILLHNWGVSLGMRLKL